MIPENKPIYLMGIGDPREIVNGIAKGIDMFDSRLPTQNARRGTLFTSKGKVYWIKAHEIPDSQRYSKGKALANMVQLREETIQSVLAIREFNDFLLFVTKKGI